MNLKELSSAQLKVAHWDQKVQIEKQHQIINMMNENLSKIQAEITAAEAREIKEMEAKAKSNNPAHSKKRSRQESSAQANA